MKLWGGRFSKDPDQMVLEFDECIEIGNRMYEQDILGSIAHATMLGAQGILSEEDTNAIVNGLNGILEDARNGKVTWSVDAEDIHMNVETLLIERIGEAGKRLHTGRSRNDQVALDNHMIVMDACREILALLKDLNEALLSTAEAHLNTAMPGYTHLQHAQPITLAHHLMAYVEMFLHDMRHFEFTCEQADEMPLGSGALAGTTYSLDRERVASLLGFSRITMNSLDGVSNRDYFIDFLSAASLTMMHLSRFCEELILWCSSEFAFIEMDDAFATGSSIMPQKKNPDVAELIRGKTGRVYGALIGLLTAMKGLPLSYNKDMQEDKELFYDASDTLQHCLAVFTAMFRKITYRKERMAEAAMDGFTNATDCADYLVKKGIAFRDAHRISGELVAYCISKGKILSDLSLDEYRSFNPIFDADIYDAISLETCIGKRNIPGAPAPEAVHSSIENAKKRLSMFSF
ncbi:MAG: argininosuccinate lyase [Clostridia bacterium]|nr:argininosuccinate lyase [Clostridia bacterium]